MRRSSSISSPFATRRSLACSGMGSRRNCSKPSAPLGSLRRLLPDTMQAVARNEVGHVVAPALLAPGLVGKIPAQADFVRINANERTALELARWLEEAQESLRRAGSPLPPGPIFFVYSTPLARNVLIGALVPSHDQVGRAFPVAAFAPLESKEAASHFPLVPLAFSQFLGAAAALLASVPRLMTSKIVEQLNSLPRPGAGEWSVAEEQRR